MDYLRVRNWSEYQHYSDRNPPWIKFHVRLLDDYEFTSLPDTAKAHLGGIFLLASKLDNKIPADPRWIARQIGATSPVRLGRLDHFLEPFASKALHDGVEHDASSAQEECNPSRDARLRGPARSASASASAKEEEVELPGPLNTPAFAAKWDEWLTWRRRERGKAVSETAARKQLAKLAAVGEARAIQALDLSIQNDWQGVFPEKLQGQHEKEGRDRERAMPPSPNRTPAPF